jgi:glucose-6-phosphate 1-dehydrogenase
VAFSSNTRGNERLLPVHLQEVTYRMTHFRTKEQVQFFLTPKFENLTR